MKSGETNDVVIKNGELIAGVVDKAVRGAEEHDSLLHRVAKDYGNEQARQFLKSILKVLKTFLTRRGFSYGFNELELPTEAKEKIRETLDEAYKNVLELNKKYRAGTLEGTRGLSPEDTLEFHTVNELARARERAGRIADKALPIENSGAIMARTGARGSSLNVGQMTAALGQQSVRGKRIEKGLRGRSLSHFPWNDPSPESKGFVKSNYRDGLNPTEFFFHAMGGREGLVDTAVRTQQSGYMQRRLINALEHLRVEHDSTVRDSRGNIIQVRYGEDGVDVAKSDHGKSVNIDRLVEHVRLTMKKGTAAGKEYVEEQVDTSKEVLSPLTLNKLRQTLLNAKLTKTGVDEAVAGTIENYKQALVEPGEAAGIVSAQSIGEPGTQMTLRTFHFAGVREQNVTLGLPRLIEIVDARKIPSTPNMTVFLDAKRRTSREKAQEVATLLTHTTLGDIASTFETDVTRMRIDVKLNPQAMREREVSVQEVREALVLANADVKVESYSVEIKTKDLEIPQV